MRDEEKSADIVFHRNTICQFKNSMIGGGMIGHKGLLCSHKLLQDGFHSCSSVIIVFLVI